MVETVRKHLYQALQVEDDNLSELNSRAEAIKGLSGNMVQEAFVKLWENRQNFSSLLTIRSYLYTIVRNSGINYLRYMKMKAEKLEERGEETETSAVELIIRQEVERQLLEMIQELTPECRRVVNLLSEGKSYKEVGELLHISANTVKISRSGL